MPKAVAHYYYSTRHPRKPIRLEVTVSGGDLNYTLDVHGRFANQREASYVGKDIICKYNEYSEEFGRIVTEDVPPKMETID